MMAVHPSSLARCSAVWTQFTGKERDAETGLDYFGARYYSGSQGRFTAIDPGPFTIADPQSWNRYSYVQNNPLKFIDPKGTTLFLVGSDADDLLDEMEKKSGLHLSRDAQTGEVTIDKGTKRDKIGSKSLANKIKQIIGDKQTDVILDVGQNQERVMFDALRTRTFDMADYNAFNAVSPAFAAASLGHVLEEYYTADKSSDQGVPFLQYKDPAHLAGMKFEMNVMSDFTGKRETQTRIDFPGPNPPDQKIMRFTYSSVIYDVLIKSGTGKYFDKVERVTETQRK
jgi:RHS repeat-associated protein